MLWSIQIDITSSNSVTFHSPGIGPLTGIVRPLNCIPPSHSVSSQTVHGRDNWWRRSYILFSPPRHNDLDISRNGLHFVITIDSCHDGERLFIPSVRRFRFSRDLQTLGSRPGTGSLSPRKASRAMSTELGSYAPRPLHLSRPKRFMTRSDVSFCYLPDVYY